MRRTTECYANTISSSRYLAPSCGELISIYLASWNWYRCICCTLREDLLVEVAALAREGRFDHLIIESTGISEPLPVAETFTFELEPAGEGGAERGSVEDVSRVIEFEAATEAVTTALPESLMGVARLDSMVTVVDGVGSFISARSRNK